MARIGYRIQEGDLWVVGRRIPFWWGVADSVNIGIWNDTSDYLGFLSSPFFPFFFFNYFYKRYAILCLLFSNTWKKKIIKMIWLEDVTKFSLYFIEKKIEEKEKREKNI